MPDLPFPIIYVSFNTSGSNVVLCTCRDNHVGLLYLYILFFVIVLSSLVILSYCRSSLVYRSLILSKPRII
jgi:hypothetical protein